MSDLGYPEGEERYGQVLLKLGREKSLQPVNETELAIFSRLQELRSDSDGYLERQDIQDALNGLLVESAREYAIFMLDPDGRVASWNAGAERIKGYSAEEIIG